MNSENKKSFSSALLVHPLNQVCETCGVYYGFDPGAEDIIARDDPDEYAELRAAYGIFPTDKGWLGLTTKQLSQARKNGATARMQQAIEDLKAKNYNYLEVKASTSNNEPFIPYDFQTKVFEQQLKELRKVSTPADKWEKYVLNWFASYPR